MLTSFGRWIAWSLICGSLTVPGIRAGEFELKLSPEYGYFGSGGGANISGNYNLFAGLMTVGYRFRQTRQNGVIQLRFRPERYGIHSSTSVLFWNGHASYFRQWGTTQWGFMGERRRMNFFKSGGKLYQDIGKMTVNGQWQDSGPWLTDVQFTYFTRSISGDSRHVLTSPYAVFRARYRKSNQILVSAGFYAERFNLKVPFDPSRPRVNKGWGVGPELNIEYRSERILSFNYLAVFRESDVIHDPSHEHRISLLLGLTVREKYSLFLFGDYAFKIADNRRPEYSDLYYHSSTDEKRFYVKIGYDLKENLEVFIKGGYVKYELYDFNSDFSGALITTGISAEL